MWNKETKPEHVESRIYYAKEIINARLLKIRMSYGYYLMLMLKIKDKLRKLEEMNNKWNLSNDPGPKNSLKIDVENCYNEIVNCVDHRHSFIERIVASVVH